LVVNDGMRDSNKTLKQAYAQSDGNNVHDTLSIGHPFQKSLLHMMLANCLASAPQDAVA
jgi:hypothetical protein